MCLFHKYASVSVFWWTVSGSDGGKRLIISLVRWLLHGNVPLFLPSEDEICHGGQVCV